MNKILRLVMDKLSGDKYILSRSFIIIAASLFANFFAYLFQLASGRYLSVEDYSILVSLFSLSGILLTLLTFFTGGITKLVAEIKDDNYPVRISALFVTVFKVQFFLALTISLLIIFFTPFISDTLKITNREIIFAFSFAIFAGNLIGFMVPFLQGLLRFKAYSLSLFLAAFTKFLVAIFIILLGLGLVDIFWGLFIATLLVGYIQFILLQKNLTIKNYDFAREDFSELVKYSVYSSLGVAGLSLLQNVDVLMVKYYFPEMTAGIYSSVSVIGKIIFFAASPITIIVLPICAQNFKKGLDFTRPFLLAVLVSTTISFVSFLVYTFFPGFLVEILFSNKYIDAVPLLGIYALYMIFFTLLNLLTIFLISISKFKLASVTFLTPIIQLAGIVFYHDTLREIIVVNIISCIIVILAISTNIFNLIRNKNDAN